MQRSLTWGALSCLIAIGPACSDDGATGGDACVACDAAITPEARVETGTGTEAGGDGTPGVDLPTSPAEIGTPCSSPTDCPGPGAQCLQGGEWVWPGGYCSVTCDSTTQPDPCPAGSHCEELAQTGPNIVTCIKDCTTDGDCRTGYVCAPIPGTSTGGCVPFS